MISIQTRRFGKLEVDEGAALEFPQGLPGFEGCGRFAVVERPQLAPVVCLQSLDSPDVCFWAAPARFIDEAYSLEMGSEDLRVLGFEQLAESNDLLCLAILCAPENGPLTANLLAPVVVNLKTRVAVQAVRADNRYSHRHPVRVEAAAEPVERKCW
jgi:flagellar assembly factor FliW